MFRKRHLDQNEENLAVELYLSSNADVYAIVSELWALQAKYKNARKIAEIGSVAKKFNVSLKTMSSILKRNGISRGACPARVLITKKTDLN